MGEIGDIVHIYRQTEKALLDIGTAKLREYREQNVVAEIITQNTPYRVAIGDYITRHQVSTETKTSGLDIDYYFYGKFRTVKK